MDLQNRNDGIEIPPDAIAEVTRLYGQMRRALTSGDLSGFAAAYDSLGAIVGR